MMTTAGVFQNYLQVRELIRFFNPQLLTRLFSYITDYTDAETEHYQHVGCETDPKSHSRSGDSHIVFMNVSYEF